MRREESRSSDFEVVLLTPPYRALAQWLKGAFVSRYSGATAWDLHPFPYSPLAVARGTFHATTTTHGGLFQRTTLLIVLWTTNVNSNYATTSAKIFAPPYHHSDPTHLGR